MAGLLPGLGGPRAQNEQDLHREARKYVKPDQVLTDEILHHLTRFCKSKDISNAAVLASLSLAIKTYIRVELDKQKTLLPDARAVVEQMLIKTVLVFLLDERQYQQLEQERANSMDYIDKALEASGGYKPPEK